jgi:plastocyanin
VPRLGETLANISALCPRGYFVSFRGAPGSPTLGRLATMGFTSEKPFHEEGNQMRRSTLSMICLVVMLSLGLAASLATADDRRPTNATVSFGAWQTDPPFDRFPNSSPGDKNQHQMFPKEIRIKAGDVVNFINSGTHQLIVYDDGTKPRDINANQTTSSTGMPQGIPLIDDPTNRIYRGPDPTLFPRDRSEVLHFPNPGTYLVICGLQDHFVDDGMFGFVKVLRRSGREKEDD